MQNSVRVLRRDEPKARRPADGRSQRALHVSRVELREGSEGERDLDGGHRCDHGGAVEHGGGHRVVGDADGHRLDDLAGDELRAWVGHVDASAGDRRGDGFRARELEVHRGVHKGRAQRGADKPERELCTSALETLVEAVRRACHERVGDGEGHGCVGHSLGLLQLHTDIRVAVAEHRSVEGVRHDNRDIEGVQVRGVEEVCAVASNVERLVRQQTVVGAEGPSLRGEVLDVDVQIRFALEINLIHVRAGEHAVRAAQTQAVHTVVRRAHRRQVRALSLDEVLLLLTRCELEREAGGGERIHSPEHSGVVAGLVRETSDVRLRDTRDLWVDAVNRFDTDDRQRAVHNPHLGQREAGAEAQSAGGDDSVHVAADQRRRLRDAGRPRAQAYARQSQIRGAVREDKGEGDVAADGLRGVGVGSDPSARGGRVRVVDVHDGRGHCCALGTADEVDDNGRCTGAGVTAAVLAMGIKRGVDEAVGLAGV
eukprot:PhM_4_TR15188/c0_g1_i1/m.41335